MNGKTTARYLVSTAALTVFALLWNGLVHLVLLSGEEQTLASIHRPDMADKMWIAIVVTAAIALFFSVSYGRWRKTGGFAEAVRHSCCFAALMIVVVDLNQYAQYALPFSLVAKWAAFGFVEFILYGQIARLVFSESRARKPGQ
jgi:hypothetical protein